MTKKQAERYAFLLRALDGLGVSHDDANALLKIERTLQRWGERECGDDQGRAIERDETTGKPYWTYDQGNGKRGRYPIPDREAGALRRLAAIMAKYPALWAYHQGDPRGCAVYVGRWSDMPKGDTLQPIKQERADLSSYYTRGVAVCL
jgi:hypothetical protein